MLIARQNRRSPEALQGKVGSQDCDASPSQAVHAEGARQMPPLLGRRSAVPHPLLHVGPSKPQSIPNLEKSLSGTTSNGVASMLPRHCYGVTHPTMVSYLPPHTPSDVR